MRPLRRAPPPSRSSCRVALCGGRFRLEILGATDYVTKTCSAWYRAPVRCPSPISIPFPLKISQLQRRQAALSRDRDKWPYQEWFRSVDYRVRILQIQFAWKTYGWVNLDERWLIFRGLQEVIQFSLFAIHHSQIKYPVICGMKIWNVCLLMNWG